MACRCHVALTNSFPDVFAQVDPASESLFLTLHPNTPRDASNLVNCILGGASDHEIERVASVNRCVAPMTGAAVGTELPRTTPFPNRPGAVPPGGMDRVIQRTWLQKNRSWVGFTVLAGACTIALLSVNRDATRVLNINEGRIVASTVKQGNFDDFIPVRAQVTPLRPICLDAIGGGRVERARGEDKYADVTVAGVIDDLHMRFIHEEITPTIYYAGDNEKSFYSFILRLKPGAQETTLAAIDRVWAGIYPEAPIQYTFVDEEFAKPFAAAGMLALVIAWGTVLSHARRVAGSDAVLALGYE